MKIPILSGIYTDKTEIKTSYPINLTPVYSENGISNSYLKPSLGIKELGSIAGSGNNRGGFNWNSVYYCVIGQKLYKIDKFGNNTLIGDVGNDYKLVKFTYSFDYLAIASDEKLFLYDGTTLTQVTDADLGKVKSLIWIDGYFITTDGDYLVITELSNPFSVNPLKYGSSEVSPDPIKSLLKLRNEVYALNRYTIEVFYNTGGSGFPFLRIKTAQIERGTIGAHTCCVFLESIAFLGGRQNEGISIWIGSNAQTVKIATREIELLINEFREDELVNMKLESITLNNHAFLYIHLPDKTLVYDNESSKRLGKQIWHILTSDILKFSRYKACNFVYCYDKWLCGDPTSGRYGYLTSETAEHYNLSVRWEFGTAIIYNQANNAIFHELELVSLTGDVDLYKDPFIATQYSQDGIIWSQLKHIKAGKIGNRRKRLIWLQNGVLGKFRIQKFLGTSDTRLSFLSLEAQIEPLNA